MNTRTAMRRSARLETKRSGETTTTSHKSTGERSSVKSSKLTGKDGDDEKSISRRPQTIGESRDKGTQSKSKLNPKIKQPPASTVAKTTSVPKRLRLSADQQTLLDANTILTSAVNSTAINPLKIDHVSHPLKKFNGCSSTCNFRYHH